MEKQTIGKLIATLRKANGMTQKQLADRLCVSDKAVSRWERDECAPDLSLIPVIAEIFNVTTDELLRGQRNNPDGSSPANTEAKVQLQKRRLLKDAKTKYRIRSLISLCVALVGLIAALVCNFGFLRAYIAFGIGAAFCTVAAVLQAVFTVSANAAVEEEDLEAALVQDYRMLLFTVCRNVCTAISAGLALLLPMLMVPDAYAGIDFGSWLLYGFLFAGVMLAICLFSSALILRHLCNTEFFTPNGSVFQRAGLCIRYIAIFVAVCLVLLTAQGILNSDVLVSGTTFQTWEEFKTFMETSTPDDPIFGDHVWEFADISIAEPLPIESIPADSVGEESTGSIYEEFYETETITTSSGRVLCEYVSRNQSVAGIRFTNLDTGDGLPVTVYTYQDYRQANLILDDLVNPLFLLAYLVNALACAFAYRQKAAQLN